MNHDIILKAATRLREQLHPENELPEWAFVTAILDWQYREPCDITDDALDSVEFRAYLVEHFRRLREADMFRGGRTFSFEKFSAMTSYIAARGRDISRTKLNKLLFYSDFVNFFLHGRSISGSRYLHMPYGPVPEYYREVIDALSAEHTLQIEKSHGHDELHAEDAAALDLLSLFELATIKWVLDNLDGMNAHKITEYSHDENAFLFTRQGEFIPYEFAKYFKLLPDPVPPDHLAPKSGH